MDGSRRLHDSPAPRATLLQLVREKPRPLSSSGLHDWLTDTRQVSSRLRLAHCPITQTQQDSGRWEGKALEVVEWERD